MQKKGGVAAVDRIRYLRIEFEQETKSKKKPMQCEAKLPPKVCIHSSKISFVADEKLIHIYIIKDQSQKYVWRAGKGSKKVQNSTDSVNCFDAVIHLASVSTRVADIKICSHDSARFASASLP